MTGWGHLSLARARFRHLRGVLIGAAGMTASATGTRIGRRSTPTNRPPPIDATAKIARFLSITTARGGGLIYHNGILFFAAAL